MNYEPITDNKTVELEECDRLLNEALGCPFCGHELRLTIEPSLDGTLTYFTIHHGPSSPCSISLRDSDRDLLFKRWNKRLGIKTPL